MINRILKILLIRGLSTYFDISIVVLFAIIMNNIKFAWTSGNFFDIALNRPIILGFILKNFTIIFIIFIIFYKNFAIQRYINLIKLFSENK